MSATPTRPALRRRPLRERALGAALLVLTLAWTGAGPAAAEEPIALGVLAFGFLDTSGEPRDQAAEHAARLELVTAELGEALAAEGRFRLVALPPPPCPAEDSDCILESARAAGAEIVLAGAIQKGSSMDIKLWAGAFATATGERLFFRQMGLRGDTDEAWRRGARFLAEQLGTAPLEAP